MNRYIRYAALIGSCLLVSACEQGTAPAPSTFIPTTTFVPASSVKIDTRIAGLSWDPEAYFIALAGCQIDGSHVPMCRPCPVCDPFPPFLSEGLPMFSRAAVTGAAISAWDPITQATVGTPIAPAPNGFFEVEGVPSRADVPFFMFSSGEGTTNEPPLPPNGPGYPGPTIVPTTYFPTVSMRPINTMFSTCTSQESVVIGRNGVLEAVAKHLTENLGRPTLVADFMDPTRYHSVAVVVTHHAGNQALRAPADGISLEGTQGEVYVLDWAPLPADTLRSARGFIVTNEATSPVGFNVVLMRATNPRPEAITYKFNDTKTDSVSRRPWAFRELQIPPFAGMVTYIGAQAGYAPVDGIPRSSLGIPPYLCVPGVL
jgi:hypothetical protein